MSDCYYCNICQYSTVYSSNYKKHLETKSHIKNKEYFDLLGHSLNIDISLHTNDNNFYCRYCKKTISRRNKSSHLKICKELKKELDSAKDKKLLEQTEFIKSLTVQSIIANKDYELRLVKKDNIIKDKELETLKQQLIISELKKELEYKSTNQTSIVNNSNNSNNSHNKKNSDNKTISFVYIKNNYTEAPVYTDVMKPALTASEKKALEGIDPTTACAKLLISRCITDIDMDKRPIHCLDMSRNKFAVRIYNKWGVPKWKIDHGGENILNCAFAKMRSAYPTNETVSPETKLHNQIGLQKMMLAINKKRILKEVCRLGHVNSSETL